MLNAKVKILKHNPNTNFMSNNNILTIGIIILAIAGVIAYSLSKKGVNPSPSASPAISASPAVLSSPTIVPTLTPQPSITPTPSVDVSDWKIYESKNVAQFPSEKYTIKYSPDWNYSEDRTASYRTIGKLETIFKNNKNEETVRIIANDALSNYQDFKNYINKGEINFGNLDYKFLKLKEVLTGNIVYIFDTGENIIADPAQKGYDEVIVFKTTSVNDSYLNKMLFTFKFTK